MKSKLPIQFKGMRLLSFVILFFVSVLSATAQSITLTGKKISVSSTIYNDVQSTSDWYLLKTDDGKYVHYSSSAATGWAAGSLPTDKSDATKWKNYLFHFSGLSRGAIKCASGHFIAMVTSGSTSSLKASTSSYTCDAYGTKYGSVQIKTRFAIHLTSSILLASYGSSIGVYVYGASSSGDINFHLQKVTVSNISVTSITLNKSSATISPQGTVSLTATVSPSNATNKGVTWSSSNTSVATVSSSGVVTGVAVGSCTITCTAKDSSGKKATCAVTVRVPVSSISLNQSSATLNPEATLQLTATIAPSDATNKNVTWSTSNSSVATVSSTGLVTAVAAGNCVITCTAADGSGKKATCNVIVHGGPSGVEAVDLGLPSGTLWANMNVGATSPEKYGGYYAWGEITIKNNFVWSTYKYGNSATSLSKYCVDSKYGTVDNIEELEESDDAASINWSSDWTMPTYSQMKEIFSVCKKTWITLNGISGYQVVGPNGNSIFLPAGSYYDGTTLHYAVGTHGDYWTKTVGSDNTCAFGVGFSSTQINVTALDPARLRYQGRNIRPVSISKAIRVTSIEIAPAILEMNYGESKEVNYTIIPEDATDKEVTWSTSNSLIATVSSSGVVTAVGEGTCTITCTSATNTSVKATCQVIVYDIPAGLELVDLGLPSGTLWANMNVGAKKPEEYGGYYAWGETATKDEYSWEGYKLCDGAYNKLIKYNSDVTLGEIDNLTVLEPEDDAAYMTWGKFCHMPTKEESEELVSYCEMTPITVNDISGWRFVGRNGNEIFVPNGGYVTTTVSDGSHESHWTNLGDAFYLQTSGLGEKSNMNYLVTSSDGNCPIVNWETHNRKDGRNVRPVGTNKAIRVTEIRVTPAQIDLFFGGTAQLIAAVLPENATNQAVTWSTSDEQIAKITSEGLVTATGKGTAIITCTALDGSGVSGTMTVTVINEMVINDGEPLDFSDAVLDKLTYNRTMKNKEWQPLYVPFSMSYDDWKNYYDVAQINMMHQYDNDNDGEPDEMELEFFLVTKGALKPNYPYIIRLKNADDPDVEVSSSNPQNVSLVIEDCNVETTKENTVYCMSMFYEYFFTGTYEGVTNKSGYYAMSSGKLIRASETANLKPQRWYMTIFNRESQLIQPVEHVKVHVFGDTETIEDEATTIDYIESTNAPVHVYDLQGRKVKQHTRPGIYIMNNKKVLVR